MFKYLNFNKLNIVSNFDIRYSCLFITLLILAPAGVNAAPSAEEIRTLPPTEVVYASVFDRNAADSLYTAGRPLNPEDIVKVFPRLDWGLGGRVEVWRAPIYQVTDGRKVKEVRSWGLTVGEVLASANIEIGEQDKVVPGAETSIAKDISIQIIRVSQTEVKETESIDFQTIDRDDATLERGLTRVEQAGEKGQREKTYLVMREDGEEVSRTLVANAITQKPVNKIVLHGTKIIVLSSETGESSWTFGVTASRRYKKGMLIRVTNLANGKSVETNVGGYGPQVWTGRILDLNVDAWEQIAKAGAGTTSVKVEEIKQ